MIESGQHITSNKWVSFLMIFAFFWLVIGDLIILHQKAIYGFDPFSIETPFAKTDKKTNKTKTDKVSKFDKFKDQYHFDALPQNNNSLFTLNGTLETGLIFEVTVLLAQTSQPVISLRAPPQA